jgi:hypothetical protein
MRLGVMIGPERGDIARKVAPMIESRDALVGLATELR